ncbi:hypothetical protein CR513_09411, partial [Mucuna pruriens]
MEHLTDMCPTLQETQSDHPESIREIGGYQYMKQSYQSRQFDNQQFGRQPFRPGLSQGLMWLNVPTEGNSPSLEDLMKQLETNDLKFQQNMNSTKYECHHPRPQDANRIASKHYEPFAVGWVRQPALTNNSKFEGECERKPRSTDIDFEPDADSQVPQQEKSVPLSFPTRTPSTRKPESDEELLKMFWKQIPKYTKFLKELCVHKRKKMKGGVELGSIVSLANKSVVQPLGVLEDVFVQVNELIFLVDFYVLDMEDETSEKGLMSCILYTSQGLKMSVVKNI